VLVDGARRGKMSASRRESGDTSPNEEVHQKSFSELASASRCADEPAVTWDDKVEQTYRLLRSAGLHELFDKHRQEEHSERCVLRFLSASGGDVEETVKMIRLNLRWREALQVEELGRKKAEDILPAEAVRAADELLVTKILGYDMQGRPVLYRSVSPQWTAGRCQTQGFSLMSFGESVLENTLEFLWPPQTAHACRLPSLLTSSGRLVRLTSVLNLPEKWQAWIMERMLAQMNWEGSTVCILDVAGWTGASMSTHFLTWGKALQKMMTEHYPQVCQAKCVVPKCFGRT
jgi:hypothetical protein